MSVRFPGLGFSLDYVGKSVRILGFEITIYGLLIAAAMFIGLSVLVMEAGRSNENQDQCLIMAIIAIITGTVGARLFYVIFSWSLYQDHVLEIFHISGGGMSVYGALGGGILGIALFCRIQKRSFSQMADIASIGFLTGQIIGRWGDFFNRESFGEYTNSALAMQLPLSAVRSGEVTALMREHLEDISGVSCIQVHPLFLYESFWCLLLLMYLLAWKRKKKFQGEIFMRYLAGYGLGRFFIEWLRTDSLLIPGTRIAVGQVVCAALVVIFGAGASISRAMVKKREDLRRRKREAVYEAEEQAEAELDAREAERAVRSAGEEEDTVGEKKESYTSFFTAEETSEAVPKAPVLPRPYFETTAGEEDLLQGGSGEKSGTEPETGQTADSSSEEL